jgi:hypothetical protein
MRSGKWYTINPIPKSEGPLFLSNNNVGRLSWLRKVKFKDKKIPLEGHTGNKRVTTLYQLQTAVDTNEFMKVGSKTAWRSLLTAL